MGMGDGSPKVLLHKALLAALIGAGCFMVGAAYFIFTKDGTVLVMSCLVLVFGLAKSACLYRTVAKKCYVALEGTCVAVEPKPFRKYSVVTLIGPCGAGMTLRVGKQAKLRAGGRYRFYFQKVPPCGGGGLDAGPGQLLGFEELGRPG